MGASGDGWGFSGPPAADVVVPEPVARLAGGRPVEAVWLNHRGGLTFRLPDDARYVKWSPAGGHDLANEARRLAWASGYAQVPEVVGQGLDETGSWLVTRALPGRSAVDPRWRAEPAEAARAIGLGLRQLHTALPLEDCPYTWSLEDRLAAARRRTDGPASWAPERSLLGTGEAFDLLSDVPALDPVVCHGDACAPNTLIADDGSVAGHVDLGSLGVADRWADLAVAAWSTEWNYGPGWAPAVYDAYGIEPDERKIAYYRLLWDLS